MSLACLAMTLYEIELTLFTEENIDIEIFSNIVYAHGSLFHSAVLDYIRATKSLRQLF